MKKIIFFLTILALIGCVYADCQSCGNLTIYYNGEDIESNFTYTGESESFNSHYSFNDSIGILGGDGVYAYIASNISAIPTETIINTILNTTDYCDVYEMPFYWEAAVTIVNLSNEFVYQYDETILADCTTTTTTTTTNPTTTTSTTTEETNSTEETTTTSESTSTTITTTTTYNYVGIIPTTITQINQGTLPGYTGVSVPGYGISNKTGWGSNFMGLPTDWLFDFISIGIICVVVGSLGRRPKIAMAVGAVLMDFFVFSLGWLQIPITLAGLWNIIAIVYWFMQSEEKK